MKYSQVTELSGKRLVAAILTASVAAAITLLVLAFAVAASPLSRGLEWWENEAFLLLVSAVLGVPIIGAVTAAVGANLYIWLAEREQLRSRYVIAAAMLVSAGVMLLVGVWLGLRLWLMAGAGAITGLAAGFCFSVIVVRGQSRSTA